MLLIVVLFLIASTEGSPVLGADHVADVGKSNGKEYGTQQGTYPFMVLLELSEVLLKGTRNQRFSYSTCGGSLILPDLVLTAAHCLTEFITEPNIKITAGMVHRRDQDSATVKSQRDFYVHEDYTGNSLDMYHYNDLALVWVDSMFDLSPRIQIATLPEKGSAISDKKTAFVVGWGAIEDGFHSDFLLHGEMQIIPWSYCKKLHKSIKLSKLTFCAMSEKKITTPCNGDSGGPLVTNGMVVGVISWTAMKTVLLENGKEVQVCDPTQPAIFVRVSDYIDWIYLHQKLGSPKNRKRQLPGRQQCDPRKTTSCTIS